MPKKKQLISIAIYLRGYQLDPEHVSQVLGILPSRSQKKGGFKPGSTKFIAKIGLWTLEVESDSRSIPELVDEVFQKLCNVPMRLDEIKNVEEAFLDIFVPLSQHEKIEGTLEFDLTKDQIAKLSQLGLSVCFTVS